MMRQNCNLLYFDRQLNPARNNRIIDLCDDTDDESTWTRISKVRVKQEITIDDIKHQRQHRLSVQPKNVFVIKDEADVQVEPECNATACRNRSKIDNARVKRELIIEDNEAEQRRLPGRAIDVVQKEEADMQTAPLHSANVFSTHSSMSSRVRKVSSPVTKDCNLKPLFEVGDDVYAAWWNTTTDKKRRKETVWYPGKIISYETVADEDVDKFYGPTRHYRIMYDDGDELDDIEDYYVFSRSDYELQNKFTEMKWEYIGVRSQLDVSSKDKWAQIVGWYEITGEDGKMQAYSTLTDAMRAHDAIVIRKHGSQAKLSFLNIPEDYDELFASAKEEVVKRSHVNTKNIVSPEVSAKRELQEYDVETLFNGDDPLSHQNSSNFQMEPGSLISAKKELQEYDDATLFYEEKASSPRNDTNYQIDMEQPSGKRPKIDPLMEAKLRCSELWSVNQHQIDFTEQAFMKKSIFHLNSFVKSKGKKVNAAFSEFIREAVATPCFERFPNTHDLAKIPDWSHLELRNFLAQHGHDESSATQTAIWLKRATVGSFIIMRHEYPNCKFCPKRLIVDGKYIGPVYVIGVITQKVLPWSDEEMDIEENKMGGFSRGRYPIHTVCRVDWKMMGCKNLLEMSTRNYMNHVCQPTLQQICLDPEKIFAGGTTSERIRRDLWKQATIPISSDDFQDRFVHDP